MVQSARRCSGTMLSNRPLMISTCCQPKSSNGTDKRTSLARDIRQQIDKVFGKKVFRTVITKSVRLEESPAYKESIFTFAPESTGAAEYYRLCEEVMDRA